MPPMKDKRKGAKARRPHSSQRGGQQAKDAPDDDAVADSKDRQEDDAKFASDAGGKGIISIRNDKSLTITTKNSLPLIFFFTLTTAGDSDVEGKDEGNATATKKSVRIAAKNNEANKKSKSKGSAAAASSRQKKGKRTVADLQSDSEDDEEGHAEGKDEAGRRGDDRKEAFDDGEGGEEGSSIIISMIARRVSF